jgi:hypothetical protein
MRKINIACFLSFVDSRSKKKKRYGCKRGDCFGGEPVGWGRVKEEGDGGREYD